MHLTEGGLFINIHTHKTSYGKDEFALLNIFAQDLQSYKINEEFVYSIGLHPWHVDKYKESQYLTEIEHGLKSESVIAVGESGLDRAIKTPFEIQMEAFIPQLEMAEEYGKPVILHCVRAFSDILQLRKKRKYSVPWIFHGYTGNIQIARQIIEHGGYLAFGKFLLNQKSKVPALFCEIPDEYIFLEIDDSDLTISQIYDEACRLKGYSLQLMKAVIIKNFNRCFFDGSRK